jgi:uncharacterized phage-associated protein
MHEDKVICPECRDDVSYTVTEQKIVDTLDGESYEYMGRVAHCAECGAELYVGEINDTNLKALYDAIRIKRNLISLEKILEIPEKYAIGKRPLSLLLGWGELTFSRYCDGFLPRAQYSVILQRIYDDPQYYGEFLEQNKDNLKSPATYEKSKRAVASLLGTGLEVVGKVDSKIDLAIGYLLEQCEDVTHLTLQKALYYIQGFYYAFNDTFLFSEDCEAWVHGPVYRDIYARYSSCRRDPIESVHEFDATVFTVAEKAVLDSVVRNLCCYSGKVLERFTHAETPWIRTRGDLSMDAQSTRPIEKEAIGQYFVAVKEKYNMLTPSDIKAYSQTMFGQI